MDGLSTLAIALGVGSWACWVGETSWRKRIEMPHHNFDRIFFRLKCGPAMPNMETHLKLRIMWCDCHLLPHAKSIKA
jgi:hypothetical protein